MKLFWRAYNAHVLMVAFLIGLFAAVLIGVQVTLSRAEGSIKSSLAAVIFLQNNISDADAAKLQETIKAQDPEILSIDYMSRTQAYEEALKDPALAKSLALLKSNPLPPSITVRFTDLALWERPDPTEKLRTVSGIQEIRWDPQALALFRSLHRWRLWGVRFSGFIATILLVWAFIGLYRVLSLQSGWREVAAQLAVGGIGGALAWGLWGVGLRSIQLDVSAMHPAWVVYVPMLIGVVAALGCFGLEVRHAD